MLATIAAGSVVALLCGVIAALAVLALLNVAERLTTRRLAAMSTQVPVASKQGSTGQVADRPARTHEEMNSTTAPAVT